MNHPRSPVRVFIVDDQEVVRTGLRQLVEQADDLVLVGEACTAAEAVARMPALRPDVAILDARLPDGSGIEACRRVRSLEPAIRALLLTSYDDDDAVRATILAGAAGYLLKDIRNLDLVASIRAVAAGRPVIDPENLVSARARLVRERGAPHGTTLTRDERRVLALITAGHTDREISAELDLSTPSVHEHVHAVLAHLGTNPG